MMLLTSKKNLSELISSGKKFIRRQELTDKIRAHIAVSAYLAQKNSKWGEITALSREFNVSRPFVYDALTSLNDALPIIFGEISSEKSAAPKTGALQHILSLRLEGKCSMEGISTVMKRFQLPNSSVGFISEYLQFTGSLLPDTVMNKSDNIRLLVFASDEVFSNNTPILVTVEPTSSAILRIELSDTRKAKDWIKHWNCIENNGHTAIYLVSDEGSGLTSGHSKGLPKTSWQPDTFHTIAHRLGLWVDRFEKSAYQAMTDEYKCLETLDSAKSDRVISKRIKAYEDAVRVSSEKIALYEQFKYAYSALIKELHVFDSNGNLRNRKFAEDNMRLLLDLIDTLNNEKLSETISKIRKKIPFLLNYFDHAQTIVKNLNDSNFDKDALKSLCAGWQWHKGYIKSKTAPIRHYCRENELFCLEITEGYLQDEYVIVKEQVYNDLNNIVQSSAMVECINSIIRPYLNTSRNQISQEMLNLIMFYHNHRRYNSGERKHKTPHEILTGEKQKKEWMELLFDMIDGNNAPTDHWMTSSVSVDLSFNGIICHRSSDDYAHGIKLSR